MPELNDKQSVLIIDSNLSEVTSLAKRLSDLYHVVTAQSAIEALSDVMHQKLPDLVICATTLQGMDGYELSRRIKSESNIQHIPVILSIALNEKLNNEKFLQCRCDDIYTKSIEPILLDYKIAYHLKKSQPPLAVQTEMIISKILVGSVSVLCDILRMQEPKIYAKSIRIAEYVAILIDLLELEHGGLLVSSAKLSLIGFLGLPEDIILKQLSGQSLNDLEQSIYLTHPQIASRLISKIMYMESISKIILNQNNPIMNKFVNISLEQRPPVEIGAELIRLAFKYDSLKEQGVDKAQAIKELLNYPSLYDRQMVIALTNAEHGYISQKHSVADKKNISDLKKGDFVVQSLWTTNKTKILDAGTLLNDLNIQDVQNNLGQLDLTESIWIERVN